MPATLGQDAVGLPRGARGAALEITKACPGVPRPFDGDVQCVVEQTLREYVEALKRRAEEIAGRQPEEIRAIVDSVAREFSERLRERLTAFGIELGPEEP